MEGPPSDLMPFCSEPTLLLFFGWTVPTSSSNQSSIKYSSSGISAEMPPDETAGVLLPSLRMALWYSSLAKTEASGASLMLSLLVLWFEAVSWGGGASF